MNLIDKLNCLLIYVRKAFPSQAADSVQQIFHQNPTLLAEFQLAQPIKHCPLPHEIVFDQVVQQQYSHCQDAKAVQDLHEFRPLKNKFFLNLSINYLMENTKAFFKKYIEKTL